MSLYYQRYPVYEQLSRGNDLPPMGSCLPTGLCRRWQRLINHFWFPGFVRHFSLTTGILIASFIIAFFVSDLSIVSLAG
jgi:hypothetical protein